MSAVGDLELNAAECIQRLFAGRGRVQKIKTQA